MADILSETQSVLDKVRARSDCILVAYSGGKDSEVVLDLCFRTFSRVEAFFMALIPGMDCVELALDSARRRYGITIKTYPHWIARKLIKSGQYSSNWYKHDDLPEWKLMDVYALAMMESGINTIATGAKRADSSWRRRFMATARQDGIVNPIAGWLKYDVILYLKSHGIPLPPSSGHTATGIDLSAKSLLWLNDNFPQDFAKLCKIFPFAAAVPYRREFYGDSAGAKGR